MVTEPLKLFKTVAVLPSTLEPNTMYAVRAGAGFDFYLSDMTGSIAYKVNTESPIVNGSSVIKTFNILNEFSAPLIGNSIYVPEAATTIKSITVTNGMGTVSADLMVGLYRNNDLLGFYTLPSGHISKKYPDLNHTLTTSDYITVNVVAGSGGNFTMVLFNT